MNRLGVRAVGGGRRQVCGCFLGEHFETGSVARRMILGNLNSRGWSQQRRAAVSTVVGLSSKFG